MAVRDSKIKALENFGTISKYTAPVKKAERKIVGREAEIRKLKAAMMRPELCNAILLAEAGSGKSLANGTEIPSVSGMSGYTEIQDLVPGDLVYDEAGYPVEVLGVYPQGLRRAYRVTFADGSSIVCNDEHLWASRSRWQHNERLGFEVRTLREMMDKGIIHHRYGKREQSLKNWYVPRNGAVVREAARLPVHPYAVGALLGDGCLTTRWSLDLSSDDVPVVERVCKLIGAAGYVQRTNGYTWMFLPQEDRRAGTRKYVGRNEVLADPMFECMNGKRSPDRRIPRPYMLGSIEQRMELLRGLMDTDGTATGSDGRVNVSFSTNSEGLASDVAELAASLGYRTATRSESRADEMHCNTEYTVYFMVDEDTAETLFSLPRKVNWIRGHRRHDKRFRRHYDDMAIVSVEDLGEDVEMTCIYVAGDSHLFQAGRDHIVTHNTALVQGLMLEDSDRLYLEVDLARMIADISDPAEMAAMLKKLFDEVADYVKAYSQEIVLFIDEFHQIVQLSAAAVEALKPLLADSGTRGIRVIAATTYEEFRKYVSPNQPLVERLQRINLPQPGKEMVVAILRGMSERYGVAGQFPDDSMFEQIYEYTQRYVPASAQPRKSLLVLDAMVGYHRAEGRKMDMDLLGEVIYQSEGVNVAMRVDATKIKDELDKHVLSQKFATTMIQQRLQICVADLNNKGRPMSSFLFSGSTGVGKQVFDKERIPVWTPDGSTCWKYNGNLEVGDYVFNRKGEPVEVIGVFPQGVKDVYEVELTDGRRLLVGDGHLWTYKSRFGNGSKTWKVADTVTLMKKMSDKYYNSGRSAANVKFVIPMNQAVQWPERKYKLHPYVMGALLGNGCLSEVALSLSSDDVATVEKVGSLLGATAWHRQKSSYTWVFDMPSDPVLAAGFGQGTVTVHISTKAALSESPGLVRCKSPDRYIPEEYMHGSVEQRWDLVRGLFDTDGHIGARDGGRYNVSYSSGSLRLVKDIQSLLYSLGISSSIKDYGQRKDRPSTNSHEYHLHVNIGNPDKWRFFSLPRKLAIAEAAKSADEGKSRVKKFGEVVGIRDIRRLNRQESMTCIMVDDDEHLYQAGDYIVTHNTEVCKQLARILFENERSLILMDMTEYANPDSLERFRRELTNRVWARPYSIVLLDEIEKACAPVTRLLLQVLDDGRLSDENNRIVSFVNCYVVLTTNAGSEIYKTIAQYNADDEGSGKDIMKYNKVIRDSITKTTGDNRFPPELLGRIDCVVPFQPLSEETMKKIVEMNLKKLYNEVKAKHGVKLRISRQVIRYLVEDTMDTDSDAGGARAVKSKLESEVTVAVAEYINAHPGDKVLFVDVEGTLVRDNENSRLSQASIVVRLDDGKSGK